MRHEKKWAARDMERAAEKNAAIDRDMAAKHAADAALKAEEHRAWESRRKYDSFVFDMWRKESRAMLLEELRPVYVPVQRMTPSRARIEQTVLLLLGRLG